MNQSVWKFHHTQGRKGYLQDGDTPQNKFKCTDLYLEPRMGEGMGTRTKTDRQTKDFAFLNNIAVKL